ncbi:MAG: class I SAM-dependent methyltransferase [Myxococcales bacterium]|nr:class I SAM-dependent methyltransferase [Myxococcales bacterium]
MTEPLIDLLPAALARRAPLLEALAAEGTTAVRLFHGAAEGRPGLTVDAYGAHALVQTFREPLTDGELAAIEDAVQRPTVWRHRGRTPADPPVPDWARAPTPFAEHGLRVTAPLVHRGQDPHLFLDFRAARRWLKAHSAGKRVLNTFAYTGFAGLICAAHGAAKVTQLDHGRWCLDVAERWARAHELVTEIVREDFIPAVRQWAGLNVKGRGAQRGGWSRRGERRFDLVILDPPTFTKTRFGAVDIERDYASLAKPALKCLAPGGALLATNHSPRVDRDAWIASVRRAGEKAGVTVSEVTVIEPDADFPSYDGQPPLSCAVFHTA